MAVKIPESFHNHTLNTWHLNYLNHSSAEFALRARHKAEATKWLCTVLLLNKPIFAPNYKSSQVPVIFHTLQNCPSLSRSVSYTAILTVEQEGHLCGTRGRHPDPLGQPAGHTYLVLHYSAQSTLVLFVWGQADFQQGCSRDQNMQVNWMHPVGRCLLLHLQLLVKRRVFCSTVLIRNHKGDCQGPSIQKDKLSQDLFHLVFFPPRARQKVALFY